MCLCRMQGPHQQVVNCAAAIKENGDRRHQHSQGPIETGFCLKGDWAHSISGRILAVTYSALSDHPEPAKDFLKQLIQEHKFPQLLCSATSQSLSSFNNVADGDDKKLPWQNCDCCSETLLSWLQPGQSSFQVLSQPSYQLYSLVRKQ